jgi:hypothetical protein
LPQRIRLKVKEPLKENDMDDNYAKLEEQNKIFKTALNKIRKVEVHKVEDCDPYGALGICKDTAFDALKKAKKLY